MAVVRSWLAMRVITRNLRALNQGDIRPTLRMDASDVHFRFPGTSSWATDVVGREKVEEWLKRMAATGLQHEAMTSLPAAHRGG
jgi:ketosteroid isomerase-like protein